MHMTQFEFDDDTSNHQETIRPLVRDIWESGYLCSSLSEGDGSGLCEEAISYMLND